MLQLSEMSVCVYNTQRISVMEMSHRSKWFQEIIDEAEKDFRELIGIEENKPFECVGTRREVQTAMKYYRMNGQTSLLTDRYAKFIDDIPTKLNDLLSEWNDEHNVPDKFAKYLKQELTKCQL